MKLPIKLLELTAFNSGPKIEEHISVVMDISTHEEHLSQQLQTNKQFKIGVTLLTGYNGFLNVTISNNKFYLTVSINDDDFSVISFPLGAYETESLNNGIKRFIIEEGFFTEAEYPFKTPPNFSTLVSIIKSLSNITGSQIAFTPDFGIRDLFGFIPKVLHEELNLSDYLVDILSFDNIFLECDIAQGMIFKSNRSGKCHNFTMDVELGYKYIEKFRAGVQCYTMESKNTISSICFKLKN